MRIVFANSFSISLVCLAGYMAHEHIQGIGWVVVIAALMSHSISDEKEEKETEPRTERRKSSQIDPQPLTTKTKNHGQKIHSYKP